VKHNNLRKHTQNLLYSYVICQLDNAALKLIFSNSQKIMRLGVPSHAAY